MQKIKEVGQQICCPTSFQDLLHIIQHHYIYIEIGVMDITPAVLIFTPIFLPELFGLTQ
ncbi:hypothetical protein [Salinicoccus halodurans]|uniref:hypothetical protein n=1 Tax=Salinicoccus halodurans TaxID=407035 RepID=UPI000B0B2901|nr:hypothetical protein [Salinicoccus halodurans]